MVYYLLLTGSKVVLVPFYSCGFFIPNNKMDSVQNESRTDTKQDDEARQSKQDDEVSGDLYSLSGNLKC